MYKRYQGNSGRMERVGAPPAPSMPPPPPPPGPPMPRPGGIAELLGRFLPFGRESPELEDLLLLLILYLLYRESGDRELLIIMGAMLLLP